MNWSWRGITAKPFEWIGEWLCNNFFLLYIIRFRLCISVKYHNAFEVKQTLLRRVLEWMRQHGFSLCMCNCFVLHNNKQWLGGSTTGLCYWPHIRIAVEVAHDAHYGSSSVNLQKQLGLAGVARVTDRWRVAAAKAWRSMRIFCYQKLCGYLVKTHLSFSEV